MVPLEQFARRNMVRNALKDGLPLEHLAMPGRRGQSAVKNCQAQADAATAEAQDNRGASGDVYGRRCIDPAQ